MSQINHAVYGRSTLIVLHVGSLLQILLEKWLHYETLLHLCVSKVLKGPLRAKFHVDLLA